MSKYTEVEALCDQMARLAPADIVSEFNGDKWKIAVAMSERFWRGVSVGSSDEDQILQMFRENRSLLFISKHFRKPLVRIVNLLRRKDIPAPNVGYCCFKDILDICNHTNGISYTEELFTQIDELASKTKVNLPPFTPSEYISRYMRQTMQDMANEGYPAYDIAYHAGLKLSTVINDIFGVERCVESYCKIVNLWVKGCSVEFITKCTSYNRSEVISVLNKLNFATLNTDTDYNKIMVDEAKDGIVVGRYADPNAPTRVIEVMALEFPEEVLIRYAINRSKFRDNQAATLSVWLGVPIELAEKLVEEYNNA